MMIINDDNAGIIDEEAHKNTVDNLAFTCPDCHASYYSRQ